MAAYALALGANNLQVGVLAALPFVTQLLQLPAILAVERFRARKAMGIPALLATNLMWIPIGAVPFLMDTPGPAAVVVVIAPAGCAGAVRAGLGDLVDQLDAGPGASEHPGKLLRA